MKRPWIELQDRKVIELWFSGHPPKDIVIKLNLSSIWAVYDALRRGRKNGLVPRLQSISKKLQTQK